MTNNTPHDSEKNEPGETDAREEDNSVENTSDEVSSNEAASSDLAAGETVEQERSMESEGGGVITPVDDETSESVPESTETVSDATDEMPEVETAEDTVNETDANGEPIRGNENELETIDSELKLGDEQKDVDSEAVETDEVSTEAEVTEESAKEPEPEEKPEPVAAAANPSTSSRNSPTPDKQRKSKAPWGLAIGVSLVAIVASGLVATGVYKSLTVEVPMATQHVKILEEACGPFKDAGLDCVVEGRASLKSPKGTFIDQSIAKGATVPNDSKITLVYSAGNQKVEMPDVVGLNRDAAQEQLMNTGLVTLSIVEMDNSGVPAGQVVKTSVKAGSEISLDSEIVLTVSSGKNVAPDFDGMNSQEAEAEAKKLGIELTIKKEVGDSPFGQVINQTPEVGKEVENNKMTITISIPGEGDAVEVPEVSGMTEGEAMTALYNVGLTRVSVVYVESSDVTSNEVIGVSPNVGNYATIQDNVVLVVATPK